MILKIKTGSRYGWKFFSGITEMNYWKVPLAEVEKMSCDGGSFISKDFYRPIDTKDKKPIPSGVVCIFSQETHRIEGENKNRQVIFNAPAYILDDEGKTIERI